MKRLAPLLLLVFFASACSKGPSEETENKPNQAPSAFQTSISGVTPATATISWTTSTDPEGTAVTYSVVLGTDTISRKQSTTTYTASNLQLNTAYTGSVIAYDAAGNLTKAASLSTTDHPAPSDFIVSLKELGRNYSIINWTASTLPNNAAVTYDIYLNNQLVARNITVTTYKYESLPEKTGYTAKVVAKSSAGKSTERTTTFTTLENTAPTAPVFTVSNTGFTSTDLSFTTAVAPSGYSVQYALFINGQWYSNIGSLSPNQTFTLQSLSPGTTYNAYVAAFTYMKDTTKSNVITFTTPANPSLSALSISENTTTFSLKFKKGTTAAIKSISLYNYDEKINATPTSTQTNGDEVTVTYSKSVLSAGVNNLLKLEVEWGWGYFPNFTTTVTYRYFNYTYTASTVSVIDAWITTSPYIQFNILFKDHIISEYNDWDIIDVAFEQFHYGNLLMPSMGAANKAYITGNLSMAQADALKTGSKGYVIIKDASGYHKHEFTYTFK